MKRSICLLAVLYLFTLPSFAQAIPEENSQIPIKFEQSAQAFARFNTLQDFEPSLFSVSAVYDIWGRRFYASGGFLLEKGDTQFTVEAGYKFFKHEKLSLATGIIYNFNWLHDISLTNNFLPCLSLEWKPVPAYTLELSVDYFFKLRRLFVMGAKAHPLINTTMAVVIKNKFNLQEDLMTYIEFSSIEEFRYMVFCAPSFILGAEYTLNDNLDLLFEAAIRYIDFFTLSAHYADSDLRLGVRYRW